MYATIDLESVPDKRAELLPSFLNPKPDSRLKDPLKIEESIREKRQTMKEKFALHWTTAQVVCLSVVSDEEPPLCWYGEDETAILKAFGDYLLSKSHVQLCGAYTADFDIPLLTGRFMVHDLGIPPFLRRQDPDRLSDVNQIFGYSSQSQQRGSLAAYAFALQIEGKLGHGSNVADWYNMACLGDTKAWEQMSQYCIQDSMIAHEMLKRYRKNYQGSIASQIMNPPF